LQKDISLKHCMADGGGGVVIAPDGHLSICEHYIDSNFFGHIDSEERDEAILLKFKERQADNEACATCFYYPQCILLTMCEIDVGCTPEYHQERLHDIKESMKYEYERYKML
jgi:radical SAM protein with 4Fe4S-binding SPASM domain